MENTKKMILVEPSVLEKLKQKEHSSDDTLSRLDKEMDKIIRSKMDDREKWSLYYQTLQRYFHFSDQNKLPLKLSIVSNKFDETKHDKIDNQTQTDPVQTEASSEQGVLHVYDHAYLLKLIPKTFKQKGKILIDCIQQNPDQIKWDDKGTVFLKNKIIPNSNIIDLINDILRQLKRPKPIAWEEFSKTLIDIGVPLSCIGNRETQAYLKNYAIEKLKETPTPVHSSESLRTKGKRRIDWERWTPY